MPRDFGREQVREFRLGQQKRGSINLSLGRADPRDGPKDDAESERKHSAGA